MKRTWYGKLTNVGRRIVHHYEGNTCVGSEYVVYLAAKLDRERDRVIMLDMTPDMARFYARQLMEYADQTDAYNKD